MKEISKKELQDLLLAMISAANEQNKSMRKHIHKAEGLEELGRDSSDILTVGYQLYGEYKAYLDCAQNLGDLLGLDVVVAFDEVVIKNPSGMTSKNAAGHTGNAMADQSSTPGHIEEIKD